MATWLDYYIDGAAERMSAMPGGAGHVWSDIEAMRAFVFAALDEIRRRGGAREMPEVADRNCLMAALLPWVVSESDRRRAQGSSPTMSPLLAWQLTPAFLAWAVRGHAPRTEDHREVLARHNLYLDLPGRGVPITDEQSIRAILIQPTASTGYSMVVCILTDGRSNRMTGRYSWVIGPDEVAHGDSVGGSIESGLPVESVSAVVMRITRIAILYSLSSQSEKLTLPRRESVAGTTRKKTRARAKTHSLFSVRVLDRAVRTSTQGQKIAGGAHWMLREVVEVAGHFRWQRYGPKNSCQKLIFVESYEKGPRDAERRVPIVRV